MVRIAYERRVTWVIIISVTISVVFIEMGRAAWTGRGWSMGVGGGADCVDLGASGTSEGKKFSVTGQGCGRPCGGCANGFGVVAGVVGRLDRPGGCKRCFDV